ncbi:MAG: hypothetical protein LUQ59_12120 [Methanothrix sp.]|nr:hypothetical protein [Methanothrix sp.]
MKVSRVWLVHPIDKQDLSSAAQYGSFHTINHRFVYADQIGDDGRINKHFIAKMREAAQQFDAGNDYLLIAGDHLQIAQMCAFIAQMWGSFKVLRWDRKAEGYYPVILEEDKDSFEPQLDDIGDETWPKQRRPDR